jgi:hypothetical protein
VEVRGPDGTRPIKMSTKTVSVTPEKKMIWHEPLQLYVSALCTWPELSDALVYPLTICYLLIYCL